MTRKKKIHRGEILAAVIARSGKTITDATNQAGYSRNTYYNHTKNADLPFHILEKYGEALKVDFSEYFPEMNLHTPYPTKRENLTTEQAIKERDYWKEKYYNLLEKYHEQSQDHLSRPKK